MEMHELAQKLMSLDRSETGDNLASAIFGTTQGLAHAIDLSPRFRVGLWPCISETHPEIAMGLFALLGYLLEQRQSIRVYRIFAKLEGEPDHYDWSLDLSQFDVDDWAIDDLDENIAIWGKLDRTGDEWKLVINVENDLTEDDNVIVFNYQANGLGELVSLLPEAARSIAESLEVEEVEPDIPVFIDGKLDDAAAAGLLPILFHWERKLLLSVWGKEWYEDEIVDDYESLMDAGQQAHALSDDWSVASPVAHAMLPGYGFIGELLTPYAEDIVERFEFRGSTAARLARALRNLKHVDEAYNLLERVVEEKPQETAAWLTLARLYGEGRRLVDAIDAYQRAIESDCVDEQIYAEYAQLLLIMEYENRAIEEFVLIDPDEVEIPSELIVREAVEALQAAFEINPNNVRVLHLLITQVLENQLEDERFWPRFENLVRLDSTGDLVRTVVDSFDTLEDITPGITVLEQAIAREPDRCDLHINLAAALLANEDEEAARTRLETARTLAGDDQTLADIDRLMLVADDPDFEAHLGEIISFLDAGRVLRTEDVEFLEQAVETVTTFADGYLLLAKAYTGWGEPGTALETLLDAEKHNPGDPDILEMLARLLWESGEQKLALNYLKTGLAQYPNHVPLLALNGLYLFQSGQEEAARVFLVRAEALGPRHSAFNQARNAIAKMLNKEE